MFGDLIPERSLFKESSRKEREYFDACEEALVSARESIQKNAVTRRLSIGDSSQGNT